MQNSRRSPRTALLGLAAATVFTVGATGAVGYTISLQNTGAHTAAVRQAATPASPEEAGLVRCIWDGGSVVDCFRIHGSDL